MICVRLLLPYVLSCPVGFAFRAFRSFVTMHRVSFKLKQQMEKMHCVSEFGDVLTDKSLNFVATAPTCG